MNPIECRFLYSSDPIEMPLLPGVFLSSLRASHSIASAVPDRGHDHPQTQTDVTLHIPAFLGILATLFDSTEGRNGLKDPFSNEAAFYDAYFSGNRPIIGVGHHFIVYASPFDRTGKEGVPERARGAEVYCMKTPNLTSGPTSSDYRRQVCNTILQEIRVLCHPTLADHENIIRLLGVEFQEDYDDFKIAWPILLMEYAEYGTLDMFQEDTEIPSWTARLLLMDVAIGLRALHRCNIIHGDVKSENVLICRHPTRQYIAKLSDFGFAVINPAVDKDYQLPGNSPPWRAPESSRRLSVEGLKSTDIYSFGLTIWRTVVRCPNPFGLFLPRQAGKSTAPIDDTFANRMKSDPAFPRLVIQTINQCNTEILVGISAEAVICSTLNADPAKRSLEIPIIELSKETNHRISE